MFVAQINYSRSFFPNHLSWNNPSASGLWCDSGEECQKQFRKHLVTEQKVRLKDYTVTEHRYAEVNKVHLPLHLILVTACGHY